MSSLAVFFFFVCLLLISTILTVDNNFTRFHYAEMNVLTIRFRMKNFFDFKINLSRER